MFTPLSLYLSWVVNSGHQLRDSANPTSDRYPHGTGRKSSKDLGSKNGSDEHLLNEQLHKKRNAQKLPSQLPILYNLSLQCT